MIFRLAILSCIVMLAAQISWHHYNMPELYYYGDGLFKCGILFTLSRLAKKEGFYLFLALDFFLNLAIIDYLYRVFSNQFILNISQYYFFGICFVILVLRMMMYYTKSSFKSLIKKIFKSESKY